jgi:predicted transcriptional regulator
LEVLHVSVKVFDSELRVMELLWKGGETTAGQLAKELKKTVGWNRNTTYTVIGKLIDKGAVERFGDNFSCRAIITKEQVQLREASELMGKLFNGSAEMFLSTFLRERTLSEDEVSRLKDLIDRLR